VIINRVWAMPSPNTFSIKPIRELVERYMQRGSIWIDPFVRASVLRDRCMFTNDLNPKYAGTHNLEALDFLRLFREGSVDGVLFDPPYSPRQAKEEYNGFGAVQTSRAFYSDRKREAAYILKPGGFGICCGWNSLNLGRKNGVEVVEVLLVCHGNQNDTIVTVGQKQWPSAQNGPNPT